jgi:hypothetical protein
MRFSLVVVAVEVEVNREDGEVVVKAVGPAKMAATILINNKEEVNLSRESVSHVAKLGINIGLLLALRKHNNNLHNMRQT